MKRSERDQYLEDYEKAKRTGIPFFPDAVFKDAVAALVVFVAIFALSIFAGASLEEVADPSDSDYTPRPEWYFLFLFQLLKYFPGELEVVGVFVIPVVALAFLVALPWTDRSARRHWSGRPAVTAITLVLLGGAAFLTVQALTATPPPVEAIAAGDQTAKIYTDNCAGCHGTSIQVAEGTDIYAAIEGGTHEGMPAWNSDLTPDEIDALVGFVLSPTGYDVFVVACADCHDSGSLGGANALEMRKAVQEGPEYASHADLGVPAWTDVLSAGDQGRLLSFLTAPDGQRLWTQECAGCHGAAPAFGGDEEELRAIIRTGGGHLEMPAFEEAIGDDEMEALALYVTVAASAPETAPELFGRYCVVCHATRVPHADDFDAAVELIAQGGAHEDMPAWGQILTEQQVDALVGYVLGALESPDLLRGQELFSDACASCHGEQGEGGPNPSRAGDIIAPISSAEYLKTRDDATLTAIISQGQPAFGMSPFGESFGGPLTAEQIAQVVAHMRSWEANPPVELPPDIPSGPGAGASAADLYDSLCSQCHGTFGEGGIGPAFDGAWQETKSDEQVAEDIDLGHQATAMIAWGEILTSRQIEDLVRYIRTLPGVAGGVAFPTFVADVARIFEARCTACHGTEGGWTGTSYREAIWSGDSGPAVIPGDPDNSPLVQTLIGTHPDGVRMPPGRELSEIDIQTIVDWVAGGAPER